jgi:outer membrane protein
MKKYLALFLFLSIINPSYGVTLKEALIQAYENNAELNAERESLKASRQDLNIATGNYLPSVTLSGSKSEVDTEKLTNRDGTNASITNANTETKSIKIEQTLIDFGRGADYKKNKIGYELAKVKLLKKEQEIFYKAIEAYTGLLSATEKLSINSENIDLLERQVETDSIRLDKGEISLSDFAQSESALAGAQAKFIEANNEVTISKLNYENIIGNINDIDTLKKSFNAITQVPETLDAATQLSQKKNPDLNIAKLEFEQSKKDVQIAQSDLAPNANLTFERTYDDDLSATYDEREKDVMKATVTWPFFSGGKNIASIKKNKNLKLRKELLLNNQIKTNQTNVATAWSTLLSSKGLLNSVQAQVKAAEIASEGVKAEYERGSGRTTLEVIQSNTLLLDAKISLASAERNYLLSQYNLLKSIGLLTNDYLDLK